MSLKIIKAGILDTIQDMGRYGHQHQGINPGGAMDRFSASLSNALLGNELNAPVIEMHYPAAQILFQQPAMICLTGADFTPVVNDKEVSLHQPVTINVNSVLRFAKPRSGARCYLSLQQNLQIDKWINSYSTNLKAGAGGYKGRQLMKDDVLKFEPGLVHFATDKIFENLPWKYNGPHTSSNKIKFIPGNEWNWLTSKSQTDFLNNSLTITRASDRMGYRLQGNTFEQKHHEQLVSSAVCFGTIQLLPNGQFIILMADHQTTGGYPRIAHVISADLPKLSQLTPGAQISLAMANINTAEEKWMEQQNYLLRLQNTCNLKMQNWLNAH